jgi:hypothetical protein
VEHNGRRNALPGKAAGARGVTDPGDDNIGNSRAMHQDGDWVMTFAKIEPILSKERVR